ncbi:MAG: DUF835 domain-containing protein [Methanobacteriota archaeon]
MGDDDLRKAFLKGYEEGLKTAWREIGSLTTRGYSSTELSVMAKSKMAVLYRDVEAMGLRVDMDAGNSLDVPAPHAGVGGRGAYLVREPRAEKIFELYGGLVRAGARGLCITRMHPDDYRRRYALPDAGYVWLSKSVGRKETGVAIVEPTALVDIAAAIADFASEGGNAAVLLEGIEYMITQNGFPSVERFLQKVNEKVVLNDSYLLISANPAALKEQEYKLLAREMIGEI